MKTKEIEIANDIAKDDLINRTRLATLKEVAEWFDGDWIQAAQKLKAKIKEAEK